MEHKKADDRALRKEMGSESSGRTPRWMIPVVGVLLVGGALVAAYYLDPDRVGEASYTPEQWNVDAKKNLPMGNNELQKLIAGKDVETAKLATMRLALRGDDGWNLVLERISQAAPEVHEKIQGTVFSDNMYWCAGDALEKGSKDARDGALIVLDRELDHITPSWAPAYVFDSLLAIWPQESARAEKLYSIMERFHPGEIDAFFEALQAEPLKVRVAAVSALREEPSVIAVTKARYEGGSPDEKDVKATKAAINKSLAAAKSPAPSK